MSRLFVSDLDGTLLDRQERLSAYSHAELVRLLEWGLPFTVASARSIWSIKPILDGLPLTLPVIEFNGAFISDLRTGAHQFCNAIAPRILTELIAKADEVGLPPFLSTFNGEADRLYYTDPVNVGMAWYVTSRQRTQDPRLRQVKDLGPCLQDQVVCVTLIGDEAQVSSVNHWAQERFPGQVQLNCFDHFYSPSWWLTVHDRRATKAEALRVLADDMGISCADITVFGDESNDIPMFEVAGRRVAVENALPEVKELADVVIGPHDADSVVKYLAATYRDDGHA